jgi:oxygen-independent coproporphyrinogen-3 oxidase
MEIGEEDRMRRFVLKSILRSDGLDLDRFEQVFAVSAVAACPQLQTLLDMGLHELVGGYIVPTEAGLELSDAIPPLFYSDTVRARMMSAAIS